MPKKMFLTILQLIGSMTAKQQSSQLARLKEYFTNQDGVLMAFLFGSRSKGKERESSDWDIGVYLKPAEQTFEWETDRQYPEEDLILGDVTKILGTDDVDLLVLNRTPATRAASALAWDY